MTRDSAGTISVKALAKLVLSRDNTRDKAGTEPQKPVPNRCPKPMRAGTKSGTGTAPTGEAQDWRAEYEERAAIIEHDGGYTRHQAEVMAWNAVASAWYRAHGSRVPSHTCAGCGALLSGTEVLLLPHGERCHTSPDSRCFISYGKRWRGEAAMAMGVPVPKDKGNNPDE